MWHTFGWEAAIGEAHDGLAARLEYSMHLLEDLYGLCQVVHRDGICDHIKAVVLVWERGICTSARTISGGTEATEACIISIPNLTSSCRVDFLERQRRHEEAHQQ